MDLEWLPAQHADCSACTRSLICAKAPLCESTGKDLRLYGRVAARVLVTSCFLAMS